jgi:sec-independent protein translocase protein TatA
MGLGAPEILIVLAVVLLLFGSTRLPALARSLGQASSEFKAGIRDKGDDQRDALAK